MFINPENPIVKAMQDTYNEITNQDTKPYTIGGGTYARHMPNTIAFGIQTPWQEDQCHQANECRAVRDFEADIKILTEAIKGLCGE